MKADITDHTHNYNNHYNIQDKDSMGNVQSKALWDVILQ